jgi:hypothetical protein
MLSAALDVILFAVIVVYIVPELFDQQTGGLVDLEIFILAALHVLKRLAN